MAAIRFIPGAGSACCNATPPCCARSIEVHCKNACNDTVGFPVTDLTVKDSSGTTVFTATFATPSTVVYFYPPAFDTYTFEFTPTDTTWYGSYTTTRTVSDCTTLTFLSLTGTLPFTNAATYTCAWCGSGYMPKTLYLTDGKGTHTLTWDGTRWTGTTGCDFYGDGTTVTFTYSLYISATGGTLTVFNSTIGITCYYGDGFGDITLATCNPPTGSFSRHSCSGGGVSDDCLTTFNSVTLSS